MKNHSYPHSYLLLAPVLLSLSTPMTAAEEAHPHKGGVGYHHESETARFGQPGKPEEVDRAIDITALDTMRYDQETLTVKPGETVRFTVTNRGKLRHEFVIGGAQEQQAHREMMKKMPGMVHEDPNAVSLEPGETKTLIWRFGNPGATELACHVPGHYEAGMVSKVYVQ